MSVQALRGSRIGCDWFVVLHDPRDLGPGGDFEALGRACGFGRPLTLDEALGG